MEDVHYIPEDWDNHQTLIAAVETEDDIGTVLRMHLIVERLLVFYLDRVRIGEIKKYIPKPRTFSGKLSLSVALGFPMPLIRIAHYINKIRNKLAHNIESSINPDDIKELARKVNLLSELDNSFTSIERQYIEFSGKRIVFGEGGPRVDFLLAAIQFQIYALKWLLIRDLKSGKQWKKSE